MENIKTLLAAAAVAQTQGLSDGSVVSTAPEQRGPEEIPDSSPVIVGEKRRRGRPPKGQVSVKPPVSKRIKPEEEDVCFICFDGGSLVLCDRKGCPKAYHPACIKRSDAFFKSKAKWNCGWHICGVCQKSSHYMCYTCTYSLCKGCAKDADYLLVRGNKGFCPTCMKTIMLIENKDQANEVQVDFDDKTSWEYLFKVYWVTLKEKLSLSLAELNQAKNRWKGYKPLSSNVIPAAVSVEVPTEDSEVKHVESNSTLSSNSNDNNVEMIKNETGGDGPTKPSTDGVTQETSVHKVTAKPGIEKHDHSSTNDTDNRRCICKHMKEKELEKMRIPQGTEWATKPLLEFVAHMRGGYTSAMSQFDVQMLLVDYANRNNLWVAHRKSQIRCDQRLKNLFGKPRVSYVQMLKLLKNHFLVEDSQKDSLIPAGFGSSVKNDREVDESDKSGSVEKGGSGEPSQSDFPQNGTVPVSPNKEGKEEGSVHEHHMIEEEKTNGGESNNSDKQTNQVNATSSPCDIRNDPEDMLRSGREETLTAPTSVGNSPSSNNMEIEKMWHYRDSDGKIRGPFSMMQLREWSTTGLYQPDMRIWTNNEQYASLRLTEAMHGKFHGASDLSNSGDSKQIETPNNDLPSSGSREDGATSDGDSKKIETPNHDGDSKKIETPNHDLASQEEGEANNVPVLSETNTTVARGDESGSWPQCWDFLKDNSIGHAPKMMTAEVENKSGPEENPRSLDIDLMCSNYMGLSNNYMENISVSDLPDTLNSKAPVQSSGILELLGPAPRSNEDQAKNSGFINLELPEEWCKFSLATSHPSSDVPSSLSNINEPIEFVALGEESVSDLLAEVDAMELQGPVHSSTSDMKSVREFLEDCKDDCFSSIEEFGSTWKSDTLSSTSCKPYGANVQSSASSEVNGNVNLVTVQGNVNLVIGGHGPELGWGASPNLNGGGNFPWEGQQRRYGGERAGRGRQGPYSKGQRVCKFYGSGHCKKGAFCDYLHP